MSFVEMVVAKVVKWKDIREITIENKRRFEISN